MYLLRNVVILHIFWLLGHVSALACHRSKAVTCFVVVLICILEPSFVLRDSYQVFKLS